ncbi:glycosyltransferase family 4 protein [Micromonospora sp. M12]
MPGRIRFHGRLDKTRLHELIRSAAVVAVPSRWHENQPMVVLEAFACGVPVVATDLGGLPELVESEVDGLVVAADQPTALGAALNDILADPGGRIGWVGPAGRRSPASSPRPAPEPDPGRVRGGRRDPAGPAPGWPGPGRWGATR